MYFYFIFHFVLFYFIIIIIFFCLPYNPIINSWNPLIIHSPNPFPTKIQFQSGCPIPIACITKAHSSNDIFFGPIHTFLNLKLTPARYSSSAYRNISSKSVFWCFHGDSNLGSYSQNTNLALFTSRLHKWTHYPVLHLTQHPFLHMKSATLNKVPKGELCSCCSPSQGAVLAHTRHYQSAFFADIMHTPLPFQAHTDHTRT